MVMLPIMRTLGRLAFVGGAMTVIAVGAACSQSNGTTATSAPPSTVTTSTAPRSTGPVVGPTAPTTIAPPNVGGPPSTIIPQEDQLLAAMHGRWTGDTGFLDIADDGSARIEIRSCPLRPGNDRFGFSEDCEARTFAGNVSVGEFEVLLGNRANDTSFSMQAFVDGSGQLHLGDGDVFAVTAQRQAKILDADGSGTTVTVDGDRCTRDTDAGPAPVACEWTTREGEQVLVIGDRVWVWDRFAGVLASPQVAFGVFRR